jgi:hypothetical protein
MEGIEQVEPYGMLLETILNFTYHMDGGMHHYKNIEWWYTSFKVFIHFIKFYVNLF